MVDGVVVHPAADGEHGVLEAGGPSPLEAHPRVAGDVDDERPGSEDLEVDSPQIRQGSGDVLEGAVDDDVVRGEELRERDDPLRRQHLALMELGVFGVELDDLRAVDR